MGDRTDHYQDVAPPDKQPALRYQDWYGIPARVETEEAEAALVVELQHADVWEAVGGMWPQVNGSASSSG